MPTEQHGAVMVAMLFTATILLFANAVTAPVHAWVVGIGNPFWLWGASFVHIDVMHLLANLLGLILVQVVFGRMISMSGWLFAILIAASPTGLGAQSSQDGFETMAQPTEEQSECKVPRPERRRILTNSKRLTEG